jgi:hypothetical protein
MPAIASFSHSFAVPAKEIAFWKDAVADSPLSPFAQRCLDHARYQHRGNWEVKFSDGVVFNILATVEEDGNVRFLAQAWNMKDSGSIFTTRPRKRLLGSYRISINEEVYEVSLKGEEE